MRDPRFNNIPLILETVNPDIWAEEIAAEGAAVTPLAARLGASGFPTACSAANMALNWRSVSSSVPAALNTAAVS